MSSLRLPDHFGMWRSKRKNDETFL